MDLNVGQGIDAAVAAATGSEEAIRNLMSEGQSAVDLSVNVVFASFVFFLAHFVFTKVLSGMFFAPYKKFTKEHKAEWDTRVVSSIHAILSSILAVQLFTSEPDYFFNLITLKTLRACVIISITGGYLIYDLLITLVYANCISGLMGTLAHHVAGTICMVTAITSGKGVGVALVFVLTEASTPFVNFRWMLDRCGLKSSKVYALNGIMMFLVFFLVRIAPIPFIAFRFATAELGHILDLDFYKQFVLLGGFAAIEFLNVYWFGLLYSGLKKLLFGPKKPAEVVQASTSAEKAARSKKAE